MNRRELIKGALGVMGLSALCKLGTCPVSAWEKEVKPEPACWCKLIVGRTPNMEAVSELVGSINDRGINTNLHAEPGRLYWEHQPPGSMMVNRVDWKLLTNTDTLITCDQYLVTMELVPVPFAMADRDYCHRVNIDELWNRV